MFIVREVLKLVEQAELGINVKIGLNVKTLKSVLKKSVFQIVQRTTLVKMKGTLFAHLFQNQLSLVNIRNVYLIPMAVSNSLRS